MFDTPWTAWRAAFPHLLFFAELILLLSVFLLLKKPFLRRSRLTEADYSAPFLLPPLFRSRSRLALLSLALLPLFGWSRLHWSYPFLRSFVLAAAIPLAWNFSTYGHNYFFSRSHLPDRALLVLLCLLVALHPAFAGLLLLQILVVMHQLAYGLPGHYRNTDKMPLIETLLLFHAALLLALFIPFPFAPFATIAFSILASSYFWSGIKKIQLHWLRDERLSFLYVWSCRLGWHRNVSDAAQRSIIAHLDRFNAPLKWKTMVFECGALLALIHPWAATAFCLGWFSLHLGIFLSSGIFFWMWMALDLALLPLVWQAHAVLLAAHIHWSAPFLASVALILAARRLWTAKTLAWIDSPLSIVYRYEAVMNDGRVLAIPASRFSPYDFPFAQGRFHYLRPDKSSAATKTESRTLAIRNEADLAAARRELIGAWGAADRTAEFDRFIQTWFRNANKSPAKSFPLWLRAPQHVWTYALKAEEPVWKNEPGVFAFRVRCIETVCQNNGWRTVSNIKIHEITI